MPHYRRRVMVMIRPLSNIDIEQIRAIDALCFDAADQYGDMVYHAMAKSGKSLVAVAEGTIAAYAFLEGTAEAAVRVRSLAVHPAHRGRGFARALLQRVIEDAGGSVDLFVDQSNTAAINLYQSVGFVWAENQAGIHSKRRMVRIAAGGSGPGPQTLDGSSVELYKLLPHNGEADLIHRALSPNATILELEAAAGALKRPQFRLGHEFRAADFQSEMLA